MTCSGTEQHELWISSYSELFEKEGDGPYLRTYWLIAAYAYLLTLPSIKKAPRSECLFNSQPSDLASGVISLVLPALRQSLPEGQAGLAHRRPYQFLSLPF